MIPYHQPSASSEDGKGGDMASTITTTLPMAAVCHSPHPTLFLSFPIYYILH